VSNRGDDSLNNLDASVGCGLVCADLMSDETAPSPDSSDNPPAEGTPRVRRISNPRIKKPAKVAPQAEPQNDGASEASAAPAPAEAPKSSGFPDFSETSDDSPPRSDWPEPEAASSGASGSSENPKRKRRRKKGKGGNKQENFQTPVEADSAPEAPEPSAPPSQSPRPQPQPQHQNQPPRTKLDPELLAKFAWKIYLSEVSEEGVALVGDNDAKELSRRCFRLAEIFLEEQARRR
jgi:hypothetical protein